MYKLKFFKKAKQQYINIGKYIAQDNLFYANEVLNRIDYSINTVLEFPNIGTKIDDIYRKIVEPNYKFKIVYKIKKDTIYIFEFIESKIVGSKIIYPSFKRLLKERGLFFCGFETGLL